jgi:DNA excision repair protein ERCC-5
LFFKRILKLLLWGVKPVFVFEGKTPDIKRKTVLERFRQRYQGNKNYKKIAQRLVMDVLENKKRVGKTRDSGRSSHNSNSQPGSQTDFLGLGSQLNQEQEDEILKMVDELEQALEFKEFEEVSRLANLLGADATENLHQGT